VGYLAYDLGFILEKKIKRKKIDDLGIPDCIFNFYNASVIVDHLKKKLYIFSAGFPEKSHHLSKSLCAINFKKIYNLLSRVDLFRNNRQKNGPRAHHTELKSNFTKEGYLLAIKKAKQYISAGDIYQVNLSQRFQAKTHLSNWEIYQRLRQISPSHFSAYFDCGDFQILSSSPERFLRLEEDTVATRPMKGTRPRGKNRLNDQRLKKDLLRSGKDKAELTMIVDLERNDLGRVCSYASVEVNKLRELEEYSTVFQTTATISGRLHKDKDRIDLLRACFPGGSITGCPKIRAMEIIEELEPTRRSVYTGCLGYLSFSGGMDSNILIRTILKKENMLYFGVGGGIVADSKPEDEYAETLVKAKAMIEAIEAL
jgi:para-aminobenzoate synthetase component 1